MSLQVEYVPIGKLKVNPRNPRVAPTSAILAIKNSIEKFGWTNPILVQKGTDIIIAGHQRVKAAKLAGIKQIPIVYLDLNDVDSLAYNIADNKLAELTDWDATKLSELLAELNTEIDLSVLGFDEQELEKLLPLQSKEEMFEIPEIDKIHTDIERGDIFFLGNHRLMCGDATEKDDVKALMNGKKATSIVTSPPYWLGKEYEREKTLEEVEHFIEKASEILAFVLSKKSRRIIINTGTGALHRIEKDKKLPIEEILLLDKWLIALRKYNWFCRHIRIWSKRGSIPGTSPHPDMIDHHWEFIATLYNPTLPYTGQNRVGEGWALDGIWNISGDNTEYQKLHRAVYPIDIPKRNILLYSDNPNIIYDPFGGSGTTLIACEQTGRRCYMMEIDSRYCQVIINRWGSYTNQKVVKVN